MTESVGGRSVGVGRDGGLGDFLAGIDGEETIVGVGVTLGEVLVAEADSDGGDLGKPKLVRASGERYGAIVDGLVLEFQDVGDGAQEIGIEMEDLEGVGIDEGGALQEDVVRHSADAEFAHGIGDIIALLKSDFVDRKIAPVGESLANENELVEVQGMKDENQGDGTGGGDVTGETGHTWKAVAEFLDGEEAVLDGLNDGNIVDLALGIFLEAALTITALEIHQFCGGDAVDAFDELLDVVGDARDDLAGGTRTDERLGGGGIGRGGCRGNVGRRREGERRIGGRRSSGIGSGGRRWSGRGWRGRRGGTG